MGQKLGDLRNQAELYLKEDPHRKIMRVILEDGREVRGIDIQRDKHGLAVAVITAV